MKIETDFWGRGDPDRFPVRTRLDVVLDFRARCQASPKTAHFRRYK